ncbi:MAG: hypothetical protein HYY17_09240 [Planctomycetes bacterium]|nr:hypothetical protein [Planctomycetota bacterium]
MRTLGRLVSCLAAGMLLAGFARQDRGGGMKPKDTSCDLSGAAKGAWCDECNAAAEKADVDKEGNHKCGKKPREAVLCVKKYYSPKCHPEHVLKAGEKCCGNKGEERLSKARVVVKCTDCQEIGDKEAAHKEGCKSKKVVKTCTLSGNPPHCRTQ